MTNNSKWLYAATVACIFSLYSCNNNTSSTTAAPAADTITHTESSSNSSNSTTGCECAGLLQSPININDNSAVLAQLPRLVFNYRPSKMIIQNNNEKHNIYIKPEVVDSNNCLFFNNQRYDLTEMHFHQRGEHAINNYQDSMEIHLIHKNKQTGAAVVVGMLISESANSNYVLSEIWNNFPEHGNYEPKPLPMPVNTSGIVNYNDATDGYYTYVGSLTTPQYAEGIAWVVMKKRLVLTKAQIEKFKTYYTNNTHPLQPINNRIVYKNR